MKKPGKRQPERPVVVIEFPEDGSRKLRKNFFRYLDELWDGYRPNAKGCKTAYIGTCPPEVVGAVNSLSSRRRRAIQKRFGLPFEYWIMDRHP